MNSLSDPYLFFALCFGALLVLERLYFRLADRHNIIDKPNHRSSHIVPVIRGGGIIFIIAILIGEGFTGFKHPFFTGGAVLIGLISFIDDIKPQSSRIRFVCHLMAIMLLLFQAGFFQYSVWLVIFVTVIAVGTVNAFNFMDGINGITGVYGLTNLMTLLYINELHTSFVSESLLIAVLSSVIVFLIFNFRKRARCFAGDVGSITLAYLQIFLVVLLVVTTNNFAWVLMFTVYGIDATITIIHRLMRKENIFEAHRTHLYQYMANERGFSHRFVSVLYGTTQLIINISLIYFIPELEFGLVAVVLFLMAGIYIYIRRRILLFVKVH